MAYQIVFKDGVAHYQECKDVRGKCRARNKWKIMEIEGKTNLQELDTPLWCSSYKGNAAECNVSYVGYTNTDGETFTQVCKVVDGPLSQLCKAGEYVYPSPQPVLDLCDTQ